MAKTPQMPRELVSFWDTRVRQDLQYRMSTNDPDWERMNLMVRNTEKGFRHGNLVSDFLRVLQTRMFARPWNISVVADDPDFAGRAEDAEIVSESVSRIANLTSNLLESAKDSLWATTGWLEVGHPLDPWSSDIQRSALSPGISQTAMIPSSPNEDEYEEVSPNELAMQGVLPENIIPFDPMSEVPETEGPAEPAPVFEATLGYPWLNTIDPRYVIIPPKARKADHLDYRARLRYITRSELLHMHGIDYGVGSGSLSGETKDLFQRVEGMDPNLFPELMCLVEVWIVRDRNNPEFNNWHLSFVYSRPEWVVFNARNPYGGMIPLIPVKSARHKGYYDTSAAKELATFADMFDIGIKAVHRRFKRTLNEKWLTSGSAGLDPKAKANLLNDDFRGEIPVNDPAQVQKQKEDPLDQQFLYYLSYIKSLAQMTAGASDVDQGQSTKDITATQSRALMEASGINVEGMKSELADAGREAVMKLMHLIGIYNTQGRTRKYLYGKEIVVMERGTHDFTASFIYKVEVNDTKDTTAEEQMMWNQFLRTLFTDTGGLVVPYIDAEELAKRTVRKFGQDPTLLASRAGGREAQGRNPQLEAQLLQNQQLSGGAPEGGSLRDLAEGQHPERIIGSRGTNMANAMSGMGRVGRK